MIQPIIEVELLSKFSNAYAKSPAVKKNKWFSLLLENNAYDHKGRTRLNLLTTREVRDYKQGMLLVLKTSDNSCDREDEFFGYIMSTIHSEHQNNQVLTVDTIIDREKLKNFRVIKSRPVTYIRAELKSLIALMNLQETELMKKMLAPLSNPMDLSGSNLEASSMGSNLSDTQTKIVRQVTREMTADEPSLILIQGGPGTGKTKIIVAAILHIFAAARREKKNNFSVLICAMSNSCIDEIGTALYPLATANGVKIIRTGNKDRLSGDVLSFSLHQQVNERRSNDSRSFGKIKHEIINAADVVLTTINSSFELAESNKNFDVCFIDEASQLTDAELIIPMHMNLNKIVLVGDQNQLQPVVSSPSLQNMNFDVSLFARYCDAFEGKEMLPILRLTEQFRMHPEIFEFPNK